MPTRTAVETEEIVKFIRAELDNRTEFCGAQAILWRMEEQGLRPLPSLRTIGRILERHGLIHRRTGRYEPKGKRYPALDAPHPGSVHQSDLRFIRSRACFDLFWETHPMPPEAVYEYIWATVDVARQRLSFYLENKLVEEKEYPMR